MRSSIPSFWKRSSCLVVNQTWNVRKCRQLKCSFDKQQIQDDTAHKHKVGNILGWQSSKTY